MMSFFTAGSREKDIIFGGHLKQICRHPLLYLKARNFRSTGFRADCRTHVCKLEVLGLKSRRGRMNMNDLTAPSAELYFLLR